MKPATIDAGRIEAMIAQLRNAATRPAEVAARAGGVESGATGVAGPDFASVLRQSLDQVNLAQRNAESLTQRFVLGDDSVNLSDVMINSQKASVAFHATVQVRNRLVSAYQDIMNMPV